jgi:crotonobetaine/carnitine-CoA ligase
VTDDRTIASALAAAADAAPGWAVVRIDGQDVTAGWWDHEANRAARAFLALGLGPGDHVATLMSNRRGALVVWVALARAGMVEVPINTAMHGEMLADQLRRADCKAIVVEQELLEVVDAVIDDLPDVEHVLLVGAGPESPRDLEAHMEGTSASPLAHEPDPDDLSLILYTSGTTGPSKGVVLTHRANTRLATAVIEYVGVGQGDVLYTAFPLFHVAARFVSVLPALLTGGTVVVHKKFSASRFWDICREEGVTHIHYLGTLPMMLYNQPPTEGDLDHAVRVAYGAGMPAEVWEPFTRRFGIDRVHELYGSTEQGIITINTADHQRPGTCGMPVSYATVEVHDEEDRPLPPGAQGEIVVRPEQAGILFRGYHGMPEATLRAWRNLWFHTGDRGHFDEEGNLIFGGRLKDAIRRRGENVSAFEVEQVVDALPGVQESAAVGVPSEIGEEEILVVIVPADDAPDPADVAAHCAAHLPAFAVPRYIRFVDALPKNSSERVLKYEIDFVDESTWDREAAHA